ncbi:MAG: energy transducer TonB [Opitutaceae bacterium]|nr:energy transducer TonB [Opitutaceae bacterium]
MKSAARILSLLLLLSFSVGTAAPEGGSTAAGPEPTAYTAKASFSKAVERLPAPERAAMLGLQPPPKYPEKWRAWGKPAYAIVVLIVDQYGNAEKAQCTEATDRAFARTAETAAEDWFFMPALSRQQAVNSKITVRVDFESPTKVTMQIVMAPVPSR